MMRICHLILRLLVIAWRIKLPLPIILVQRQLLLKYAVFDYELLQKLLLISVNRFGLLVEAIVIIIHVTVARLRMMLEEFRRIRWNDGLKYPSLRPISCWIAVLHKEPGEHIDVIIRTKPVIKEI